MNAGQITDRAMEINVELRQHLSDVVEGWKLVGFTVRPDRKADSRLPIITELTFSHTSLSPGLSAVEMGEAGEEAIWDWADTAGLLDGETDVRLNLI